MLAEDLSFAQQCDSTGQPMTSGKITIADAVSIALKNNPTISSRSAAFSAALARTGAAKAMTRPQLSATLTATTGNMPMIVPGSEGVRPQNFQVVPDNPRAVQDFMLMYPLYTGGRLRNQVRNAGALASAAASEVGVSELDVALGAKIAYNRVLLARRFVDAYQQRVNESRERVRIAEEAYKVGRIAKYDLLRNQTELAESEQRLTNSQRDIEVAVVDLKTVMGVSQESELELTGELAYLDVTADIGALQETAFNQRPEIAAACARIAAAEASLKVAKSAYKPQVYGTAMQDFETTRDDGFDSGYIVGVTAALPVLDGGLRGSAVNEAKATLQQAQADQRDAVLNVKGDVATAVANLNAGARNVGLSKAAVEQAEEDYRVIKLRYESGKAINVEVLDALAALTRALTNYADALYQHNVARDQLTRATGQR